MDIMKSIFSTVSCPRTQTQSLHLQKRQKRARSFPGCPASNCPHGVWRGKQKACPAPHALPTDSLQSVTVSCRHSASPEPEPSECGPPSAPATRSHGSRYSRGHYTCGCTMSTVQVPKGWAELGLTMRSKISQTQKVKLLFFTHTQILDRNILNYMCTI